MYLLIKFSLRMYSLLGLGKTPKTNVFSAFLNSSVSELKCLIYRSIILKCGDLLWRLPGYWIPTLSGGACCFKSEYLTPSLPGRVHRGNVTNVE